MYVSIAYSMLYTIYICEYSTFISLDDFPPLIFSPKVGRSRNSSMTSSAWWHRIPNTRRSDDGDGDDGDEDST